MLLLASSQEAARTRRTGSEGGFNIFLVLSRLHPAAREQSMLAHFWCLVDFIVNTRQDRLRGEASDLLAA